MKVKILSYSGRLAHGNCMKISHFISSNLVDNSTEVIDLSKFDIAPCGNCDYECFSGDYECVHDDDINTITNTLIDADVIIHCIPIYSGAPTSRYFALKERFQSFFMHETNIEAFDRLKHYYIVIGKTHQGAEVAIQSILTDNEKAKLSDILVIESSKYKIRSINGDLIEDERIQRLVRNFIDNQLEMPISM